MAEMTDRIASVVQGLLVYSRNDITAAPVSLNDAAEPTLRLMEHKLRSGVVAMVRNYRPDLPLTRAIPNQLQQALMNLVLIASDAMGELGILTLSTGSGAGQVWISCAGTGTGKVTCWRNITP